MGNGRFISFIEGAWCDDLNRCIQCLLCTPVCPLICCHLVVVGFFQGLCESPSGDWCCVSCLPKERQFLVALRSKDYSKMLELLRLGADINAIARYYLNKRTTALLTAIELHDVELVRFLLHHGADPNVQAEVPLGGTASQAASRSENAEIKTMVQHAAENVAGTTQRETVAAAIPPLMQQMEMGMGLPSVISSEHPPANTHDAHINCDNEPLGPLHKELVPLEIKDTGRICPSGSVENKNNSSLCVICEENCPSVGLVHAEEKRIHRCCCERCAQVLIERGMPCPICRSPFEIMRIY